MKINIVTEHKRNRWVLYMMSEQWQKHLPNCTITEFTPDPQADINFYVNWRIYNHENKNGGAHVGWFTHLEPGDEKLWNLYAERMDYCICPSMNTLNLLPSNKSKCVKHGINEHYHTRPTKFGIVAREYGSGRKQYDWVDGLKSIPDTEYIFTNGRYLDSEMPHFYKGIDYLLVLANNEGGPVPVLESLAMNKPVIAPDVGWCWEYPCIRYSGYHDLERTIRKITEPVDTNKMWIDSSNELLNIFTNLIK